MNIGWQWLVPELRHRPEAEQQAIVEAARKGRFSSGEVLVLVVGLMVAFLFTQAVIQRSAHESKIVFALVANLVIALPLLMATFVPVHLRKMRRLIRWGLDNLRGPTG